MNSGYCADAYKTMTLHDKIEFLHKVHIGEISLFDEYGNDNEIFNDYHEVQNELRKHPELFHLNDILRLISILDDDCFEITWQYNLAVMIFKIVVFNGKDGVNFFLQHLSDVPKNGHLHGWHFPIQWLIADDFGYPF